MNEVDKASVTHDSTNATRNQEIAKNGLQDVKNADATIGKRHGIGSSTTDTAAGTTSTTVSGTRDSIPETSGDAATAPTTYSRGAHSTAPGNIGATGSTTGAAPTEFQESAGTDQRF